MDMKGFQHYKEQSVNTMTQGELLLLLYDELYKRLSQAELMLDQQDYPVYEASIERAVAIIDYLDFTYELGRAKIGRRKEVLTHVKSMVGELRDAFRQAQKSGDSGK